MIVRHAENLGIRIISVGLTISSSVDISSRNSNETEDASNCLSVNSTWIMDGTATNCECYTIIYGKQADGKSSTLSILGLTKHS